MWIGFFFFLNKFFVLICMPVVMLIVVWAKVTTTVQMLFVCGSLWVMCSLHAHLPNISYPIYHVATFSPFCGSNKTKWINMRETCMFPFYSLVYGHELIIYHYGRISRCHWSVVLGHGCHFNLPCVWNILLLLVPIEIISNLRKKQWCFSKRLRICKEQSSHHWMG